MSHLPRLHLLVLALHLGVLRFSCSLPPSASAVAPAWMLPLLSAAQPPFISCILETPQVFPLKFLLRGCATPAFSAKGVTFSFPAPFSFDFFLHGFLRLFSPLLSPPPGAAACTLAGRDLLCALYLSVQPNPEWLINKESQRHFPDGRKPVL